MRYRAIAALQVWRHQLTIVVRNRIAAAWPGFAEARGQGTVEYVALILLVAGVLAGVVAMAGDFNGKAIGETIVGKLKDAIDGVGGASGSG